MLSMWFVISSIMERLTHSYLACPWSSMQPPCAQLKVVDRHHKGVHHLLITPTIKLHSPHHSLSNVYRKCCLVHQASSRMRYFRSASSSRYSSSQTAIWEGLYLLIVATRIDHIYLASISPGCGRTRTLSTHRSGCSRYSPCTLSYTSFTFKLAS
jgi:hypothetical protein